MQGCGGYLVESEVATDERAERDDTAQVPRQGAGESGGRCCRCRCDLCSSLQPAPASAPAAFAACRLRERRQQSVGLLSLQLRPRASASPPPPLMLLLLLIVAICALVGVAVSYALARLEDDRTGGGGSPCDTIAAQLELGKVVQEAVERFYEKALPTLRGYVRQPPTAFLPFAGANDEDECVLPSRDALRKVGPRSSHDSTTAFAVTAQGRLRVSISGYYYVFSQVGAQSLTARTEVVNVKLVAVRSHSESVDLSDSAPNGPRAPGEAASTTDNEPEQSEQSSERRSEDDLAVASVTPWTSGGDGQIEAPSIFFGRVVQLRSGDELSLWLQCDRTGSGSGHRCGSASVEASEACGRYLIGAHLIAPATER